MKKIAISLLALAAVSTAAFAGSESFSGDRESPAVFSNNSTNTVPVLSKKFAADQALSTGVASSTSDANYINKSQLR